jgi:hypothetical protein
LGCRLTRMEVNTLVCLKTTFDTVKEKWNFLMDQ